MGRLSWAISRISYLFYGSLVLALFLILGFFNRPLPEAYERGRQSPFLAHFSRVNVMDFEETRTLPRVVEAFKELSANSISCWGAPYFYSANASTVPTRREVVSIDDRGADLRSYLWRFRFKTLGQDRCLEPNPSVLGKEFSLEEGRRWIQKTWETWSHALTSEPILMEIDVSSSSVREAKSLLLSFGLINGTSAVFWDGELVSYSAEREGSDRPINIQLHPRKTHRLSILFYGRGFSAPGIAHPFFVGFFNPDQPHPIGHHLEPSRVRDSRTLASIVLTLLLSVFLMIYGAAERQKSLWPLHLAVILAAFALSNTLQLDHVQSTLDGQWIRAIRFYYISIIMLSILASLAELRRPLENVAALVSSQFESVWSVRQFCGILPHLPLVLMGVVSIQILLSILSFVGETLEHAPLFFIKQYATLTPVLLTVRTMGYSLLGVSIVIQLLQTRLREDLEAKSVRESVALTFTAGAGFVIYFVSQSNFFAMWLSEGFSSSFIMMLSSQFLPVLVTLGILILTARILKRSHILSRVLPASTREMIESSPELDQGVDATHTGFNWLLLNDLVMSTGFKLSNPDIVTHIMQSVFHKIHKAYFAGALHFTNSLGDAMLLTIRSPARSRNNDPVLEKLVRAYALHVDGIRTFRDSYETVVAVLKARSEELKLALEKQEATNHELGLDLDRLGFRTILSQDYYFYGINHEIANVDSKAIFVLAKSEKLIDFGSAEDNGGFIVFPKLMSVLRIAYPDLMDLFQARRIKREEAREDIRPFLPEEVYVLPKSSHAQFEDRLKGYYGSDLYLRVSSDGSRSFSNIRSELKEYATSVVSKVQSGEDLIAAVRSNSVGPVNFLEKNFLIREVVEKASSLNVVHHPKYQGWIQSWMEDLGTPAAEMISSIENRDHEKEPQNLLKNLRSFNPMDRNRALQWLTLARLRSPFRPHAMEHHRFWMEVLSLVIPRSRLFSVDSLLQFAAAVTEDRRTEDVLKEYARSSIGQVEFARMLLELEGSSAPALRHLGNFYRQWHHDRIRPEEEQKAA